MPTNLTEVAQFTANVPAPNDGENANVASLIQALQPLADRSQYLKAAIAELERGYAIDPKPVFLYARAQAERLSGDCEHAIDHYQAFLDQSPAPEREAAARANLARCKDELAAKAPPPAPTPTPAVTPAPTPAPAPAPVRTAPPKLPPREEAPWYTDALGDVMTGAGVVALGVGSYFYLASVSNQNQAEKSADTPGTETYDAHGTRVDRVGRQRTIGVISGGAGLALIAGGVLRYVLHSRPLEGPAVGVLVGPGARGVSLEQRF